MTCAPKPARTRARVPGPMPRQLMPRRRPSLIAATLILLLLGTGTAMAQDGVPEPGSGRILIILHLDGHGDAGAVLRHTLLASLETETRTGAVEIATPLPDGATLDSFTLYRLGPWDEPDTAETETRDGRDWAVARWSEPGADARPDPGEWIAMRLETRAAFPDSPETPLTWIGLPLNLTSVRIFLPATYLPITDAAYAPVREDTAGTLIGWNLTHPPAGTLQLTIRAMATGSDPALGAPPPRWGGFAVLAGVAGVAALTWGIGKKLDSRLRRE